MKIGISPSFKDFVFNYVKESLRFVANKSTEKINGKTDTKHG